MSRNSDRAHKTDTMLRVGGVGNAHLHLEQNSAPRAQSAWQSASDAGVGVPKCSASNRPIQAHLVNWVCFLALTISALTLDVSLKADEGNRSQLTIAEAFAARSVGNKIVTDDAGNVVKLAISRHGAKAGDLIPQGVGDAEFGDIVKLTKLEAVFIEKMPLSDSSYALLGQLKSLRDVRIHYPTQSKPLPNSALFTATDRFTQFLNQLPGLRVLQLKHIFGMDGDGMAGIVPQPELEHLEIDTVCAKASAVPFVIAATKLRNLQVHRCEWTDADLQRVLGSLKQLEVLELKPKQMPQDPIAARSLRGLVNCPKLKLLQLTGQWADLNYEGGFDVLTKLPGLQQVNFVGLKGLDAASEVVQRLHKARPDILIKVNNHTLGGTTGQKPLGVDDGYDWGGSVTTHG